MKSLIQIVFFVFLVSSLFHACHKKEPYVIHYPNKDFFSYDSIHPYKYLQVENYKTFQELKDDIKNTVCKDSTAVLVFKDADSIKKIRLIDFCFRGTHYDYHLRNVIEVLDDTVRKGSNLYKMDHLYEIMKKDFQNNGADYYFADNPNKLVIQIAYPKQGQNHFLNALKLITTNCGKLGMNDYLHLEMSTLENIKIIEPPSR